MKFPRRIHRHIPWVTQVLVGIFAIFATLFTIEMRQDVLSHFSGSHIAPGLAQPVPAKVDSPLTEQPANSSPTSAPDMPPASSQLNTDETPLTPTRQSPSPTATSTSTARVAISSPPTATPLPGWGSDPVSLYDTPEEAKPVTALDFNRRGVARIQKGNFGGALSDYNTAIAMDPSDPLYYINRGVLKTGNGEFADALVDYQKALALNPRDEEAFLKQGRSKNWRTNVCTRNAKTPHDPTQQRQGHSQKKEGERANSPGGRNGRNVVKKLGTTRAQDS